MRGALHYQRISGAATHRRKVSTIAIAIEKSLVLALLLLLSATSSAARPISEKEDIDDLHSALPEKQLISISIGSHQILQVICKHALYPVTCVQELSSFKIAFTGNPLEVVSLSVQAAAARADEALNLARQSSSAPGLYNLERQCASDCIDLMESTKEYLDMVVATLSNLQGGVASLASSLRDIKVWLSSSLSYQTACSDGFALAPGSTQAQIQSTQDYLAEVIGNGLSLVDIFSQVGYNLGSWLGNLPPIPPLIHLRRRRRLLSQPTVNFPSWISPTQRRLLQAPTSSVASNVVVAQDGSGNFLNITAAIHSLPEGYQGRYVIYVKKGVYDEVFNVTKNHKNITLLGDGEDLTVITGNRNAASGDFNTFRTATVGVSGSGFFARDITFRNTAGPSGHQAVALRSSADFLVFYRCSFEGYQDTLYALSSRQFYRDCKIYGTVDFIFGNAIAVFQNCELVARLPLELQQNTYTAQGRKLSADVSGFAFQNCTLRGDASLQNASYSVNTYLGRPWKAFSRVVFMQSQMEGLVQAQGWTPWNASNPFTDTLFYGEFQNRGSGSSTAQRVAWAGVHANMTQDQAAQFTVDNFIAGQTWLGSLQLDFLSTL